MIINSYVPTEEKGEDIKEIFYEELESVWDLIPNHCVKIVMEIDQNNLGDTTDT